MKACDPCMQRKQQVGECWVSVIFFEWLWVPLLGVLREDPLIKIFGGFICQIFGRSFILGRGGFFPLAV
jgi:hypothetical protein